MLDIVVKASLITALLFLSDCLMMPYIRVKIRRKWFPWYDFKGGIHFLWFHWNDELDRCLMWQVGSPVWWKPRLIKREKYTQVGWIVFAIGFAWEYRKKGVIEDVTKE